MYSLCGLSYGDNHSSRTVVVGSTHAVGAGKGERLVQLPQQGFLERTVAEAVSSHGLSS